MHAAPAHVHAATFGVPVPAVRSGGAPCYRLRGALQWRQFDEEWVVRAEPSGSLFQLDALSAAVLSLLEAGPLDRTGLLAALGEAMAGDAAPAPASPAPGAAASAGAPAAGAPAAGLHRALDDTLARLVADDLVAAPAAR